jgi:type II secretory pathway component PulF
MDNLVKLIEENKTYSNELQTDVLPVSVVREIVQEIYLSQMANTLGTVQEAVTEIKAAVTGMAEGDAE